MTFVRFSGELFVYCVLIALGGGVLSLFTLFLMACLATMNWTGRGIDMQREVPIGFDLPLAVVLGLLLYAIHMTRARGPSAYMRAESPLRTGGSGFAPVGTGVDRAPDPTIASG